VPKRPRMQLAGLAGDDVASRWLEKSPRCSTSPIGLLCLSLERGLDRSSPGCGCLGLSFFCFPFLEGAASLSPLKKTFSSPCNSSPRLPQQLHFFPRQFCFQKARWAKASRQYDVAPDHSRKTRSALPGQGATRMRRRKAGGHEFRRLALAPNLFPPHTLRKNSHSGHRVTCGVIRRDAGGVCVSSGLGAWCLEVDSCALAGAQPPYS
jgi:hypothetical protein